MRRRSEVPGRLVRRTGEFRVVQCPDLLDCYCGVIAFQISHGVGNMSCYISQHDAPTRSIRPSLGTQHTDKSPVGDPSTQHLPCFCAGFNLGWHSEITISVLSGFEHIQILARFRLAGISGRRVGLAEKCQEGSLGDHPVKSRPRNQARSDSRTSQSKTAGRGRFGPEGTPTRGSAPPARQAAPRCGVITLVKSCTF